MLSESALSLGAKIQRRELSCVEVTRFFLDRAATLNPALSAFVDLWRARALFAAARRDLWLRVSRDVSPIYGVPLGVKDLQFVRGAVTRFGSRAMPSFPSPVDDRVVAALRAAGLVFLGKTASSELGVMPVTEPDIHPPTRNPWDLERSAGGSSGGSAAAVAAGMVPFAHASDGAGSVRIPAAFAGLVGIKPGRHVVPNAYGIKDDKILQTSGAIARGVEDAAALVDAMAGTGARFLVAARRPVPARLRVGLCVSNPAAETDPAHAAAAERVAKRLEAQGATIVAVKPPAGSVEEFLPLYGLQFRRLPGVRWERAQGITRWVSEQGAGLDAAGARALLESLERRFLAAFSDELDLLVTPTTPVPPPRVGVFHAQPAREGFLDAARYGAYTAVFNITGQPAISLPILDGGALPIGVQVAAPLGHDARLFSAARWLERELGGPFPLAPTYRAA